MLRACDLKAESSDARASSGTPRIAHEACAQLPWAAAPSDAAARCHRPLGEMFCDLHDRPERMLAKGVIRDIVAWRSARTYFYYRIKRRVEELRLANGLVESGKASSYEAAMKVIEAKVPSSSADMPAYTSLAKLEVKDI